jgi:hypothetical protein
VAAAREKSVVRARVVENFMAGNVRRGVWRVQRVKKGTLKSKRRCGRKKVWRTKEGENKRGRGGG